MPEWPPPDPVSRDGGCLLSEQNAGQIRAGPKKPGAEGSHGIICRIRSVFGTVEKGGVHGDPIPRMANRGFRDSFDDLFGLEVMDGQRCMDRA